MRISVAIVLLAAGVLKTDGLAFDIAIRERFAVSDVGMLGLVQWEFLLAVCLASGVFLRVAWMASSGTFCVFAGYAAWLVAIGAANCGCFGRVDVHPKWSLALDLLVVGALFVGFRGLPEVEIGIDRRIRRAVAGLAFVSISIWSINAVTATRAARIQPGILAVGEGVMMLEPDEWIGSSLPLFSHMDGGNQAWKGKQYVLIIRESCDHCRELLSDLPGKLRRYNSAAKDRLLVVDLDGRLPRAESYNVMQLVPSGTRWLGHVPRLVHLNNGIVVRVEDPMLATNRRPTYHRGHDFEEISMSRRAYEHRFGSTVW